MVLTSVRCWCPLSCSMKPGVAEMGEIPDNAKNFSQDQVLHHISVQAEIFQELIPSILMWFTCQEWTWTRKQSLNKHLERAVQSLTLFLAIIVETCHSHRGVYPASTTLKRPLTKANACSLLQWELLSDVHFTVARTSVWSEICYYISEKKCLLKNTCF